MNPMYKGAHTLLTPFAAINRRQNLVFFYLTKSKLIR